MKTIKIYSQYGIMPENVRKYCGCLKNIFPCIEIYITDRFDDGINPDILIIFGDFERLCEEQKDYLSKFYRSRYIHVNPDESTPSDYVLKRISNVFYNAPKTKTPIFPKDIKELDFNAELIYEEEIRKVGYDCQNYENQIVGHLTDLTYQLTRSDKEVDKIHLSLLDTLRNLAGMIFYYNMSRQEVSHIYIDLSKEEE